MLPLENKKMFQKIKKRLNNAFFYKNNKKRKRRFFTSVGLANPFPRISR